jgi:hypothetical protein
MSKQRHGAARQPACRYAYTALTGGEMAEQDTQVQAGMPLCLTQIWSHEGDATRWRGREKRLESGEIHVSEHVRSE